MNKKLLINNHSKDKLLPIMDGLICWLDARDIENGNTVWVDRSGNGNNGLLRGFTFDEQTNGRIGNSLVFDGQECNVLIEIKTLPLFEGNNFSIQVNAKIPPHLHSQKLFHRRDIGGGRYFIMSMASSRGNTPDVNNDVGNKLQFVSHAYGINNHGIISNQEVINNEIRNIFVTADGVNEKLYIDQSAAYTKSLAGVNFNDNNPFILIGSSGDRDKATTTIGQRSRFNYNSVKIYNRALTEEEIQHNYLYEQLIERGE